MGSLSTPFFRFCVGLLLVVIVALVHTALQNATARLQQERALQEARRWALQRDLDELRALWRAAQPLPRLPPAHADAVSSGSFAPRPAVRGADRHSRPGAADGARNAAAEAGRRMRRGTGASQRR